MRLFVENRKAAMDMDLINRLHEFIENEARSCSMDFGFVTPEFVYRMWGGSVSLENIKKAMSELKLIM